LLAGNPPDGFKVEKVSSFFIKELLQSSRPLDGIFVFGAKPDNPSHHARWPSAFK
jgi:hypothetical protein